MRQRNGHRNLQNYGELQSLAGFKTKRTMPRTPQPLGAVRATQAAFLQAVKPNPLADAVGIDVEVPFYQFSSCALPPPWSGGLPDFCFHDAGGERFCSTHTSTAPERIQCYCAVLGGTFEQCVSSPLSLESFEVGRAFFSACAMEAQNIQIDGRVR